MDMKIQSKNGGDPTKAIEAHFKDNADKVSRDAVDLWFKESQDWLRDAAQQRAGGGNAPVDDSEGRKGRENNNLYKLVRNASPPTWDDQRQAWVFSYMDAGAVFQEFGAMPHEIRAKRAEFLAFEWPDAPKKVKEQFKDTEGDLVFFKAVNHPGIPAIGFVRYGREKTRRALQTAGYNSEMFDEGTVKQ